MRDEDGIFSHDTLTSMNIKYAKETEVSTTHRVQVSDGLNPVYLKYERDDITGRELVTFISTQLNGSEGKYKPETLNIALFWYGDVTRRNQKLENLEEGHRRSKAKKQVGYVEMGSQRGGWPRKQRGKKVLATVSKLRLSR